MNTAHLTPAFATCEALKRAGFPQDTVFAWPSRSRQAHGPSTSPRGGIDAQTDGHAAPTLTELLAHLPATLSFALPHPIFGATERMHTLEVSVGHRTVIGYHTAGSREVQHRIEHDRDVEAAAQLYLALCAAGRLCPLQPATPALPDGLGEEALAQAA